VSQLTIAIEEAVDVLSCRPSALLSDIDGTLSRIVPRPQDAVVSERARESLRGLEDRLELVAVITARDETTARSLVGIDSLTYVGNYALDPVRAHDLATSEFAAARTRALSFVGELPGVEYEEKGVSFALHYRNTDDPDAARDVLLATVTPLAHAAGARIIEGKRVVELVPGGLPDKGTAIAGLLLERGSRGAVYLGDDMPDLAVYQELRRRRESGDFPSLGIAVVDNETAAEIIEAADLTLAGVDEVEAFLEGLVERLGRAER
jgi:trehalose 6-phosphate phosphatase